ncbi:hypothetical protein COT99_01890 [Candidatus Falkowbacteria bacterium CG10_big_fil_rev_8_21_14_0_10_43_10]|uniref:Uncharacterized protein n=1 Tax=Candidatus Falkowbacteria bacterium CG10_big_fil_rev_8_21_14_0_10_43_10 TaxID=1974567 RepID=A0A2H0V284_9BACT|nr:MAG: hypothetical protein COT99_01890 [Candidatus Falkowbacteria bacterium CG10_big_fil_rev_8_21_14_0_10_43_10]
MNKIKNIYQTTIFTFSLSLLFIFSAILIQTKGQSGLKINCSYLDPITIDIFAFIFALFLVIEGIYKIYQSKDAVLTKQITRGIRISFGLAILTLHLIQIFYK